MQDIREALRGNARIFMCKNTIIKNAFGGLEDQAEHFEGLAKLSTQVSGKVGIVCTDLSSEEVAKVFNEHTTLEFARQGNDAIETVVIEKGENEIFAGPQEPFLRNELALPTKLDNGKIVFLCDYTVCEKGETLDSRQAHILKLLGIEMAEFKVEIIAAAHKK